jgi:hypothetical protein
MNSDGQITKTILINFGLTFVTLNLIINPIDLVTTFIGFSRGMLEQNSRSLSFMSIVGNDYVGAVVIKAVLITLCVLSYRAMVALKKKRNIGLVDIIGVTAIDLALLYIAFMVLIAVVGNFVALGL